MLATILAALYVLVHLKKITMKLTRYLPFAFRIIKYHWDRSINKEHNLNVDVITRRSLPLMIQCEQFTCTVFVKFTFTLYGQPVCGSSHDYTMIMIILLILYLRKYFTTTWLNIYMLSIISKVCILTRCVNWYSDNIFSDKMHPLGQLYVILAATLHLWYLLIVDPWR